ncbi:MAG: ABC transporter permease [Patescibacteria group bacterium]|jgi:ABC-2 type transport system permease protein
MISLKRINAVIIQEWHISRRSLEVIMDLPFFSLINVALFGFMSIYMLGSTQSVTAHYLLLGAVFWEIIRITQYSMTVSSLWNVWSRNLSNMFITPLSTVEYLLANMLAGVLKSVVLVSGLALLTIPLFNFNIFMLGWPTLILSAINLILFAWAIGLILLGLIFRFGIRVQALGWAVIYIFQPLCAVYFPVSIFPKVLQYIAYLFPPTYVFEALRYNLQFNQAQLSGQIWALGLNGIYFLSAIGLFYYLFNKSRTTGQFARNES